MAKVTDVKNVNILIRREDQKAGAIRGEVHIGDWRGEDVLTKFLPRGEIIKAEVIRSFCDDE